MKVTFLTLAGLLIVFAMVSGALAVFNPDVYVVGGEYVVSSGETVDNNMKLIFSQVTVEDGARVNGEITCISSALDVRGVVTGRILSYESDVDVRESAQINESPRGVSMFHYVFLFPEMARLHVKTGG